MSYVLLLCQERPAYYSQSEWLVPAMALGGIASRSE